MASNLLSLAFAVVGLQVCTQLSSFSFDSVWSKITLVCAFSCPKVPQAIWHGAGCMISASPIWDRHSSKPNPEISTDFSIILHPVCLHMDQYHFSPLWSFLCNLCFQKILLSSLMEVQLPLIKASSACIWNFINRKIQMIFKESIKEMKRLFRGEMYWLFKWEYNQVRGEFWWLS